MLSRRLLLTSTLAAAGGVFAGCGTQGGPAAAPTPSAYAHRMQSYGGREITLPARPERIVADGYSFSSMWPYGVRPAGVWGYGLTPVELGGADLAATQLVGKDAELDIEKLAALSPQLLIGYGNADGSSWQWWDDKVSAQVLELAPFVGVEFRDLSTPDMIEEYRGLARSLGGDADGPAVIEAKAAYDRECERIRTLTKAKTLSVLPLSLLPEVVYVGNNLAQLRLLKDLGVQLTSYPAEPKDAWVERSWEYLVEEKSDLVMLQDINPELAERDLYRKVPAVAAGQATTWNDKRPSHYANYAAWLGEFADAYEAAKPLKA